LNEQVIARKKPFLGICLGMQLAAKEGHEHGINNGLGWIDGRVLCLDRGMKEYRVPHIGWDDVMFSGDSPLFRGIRSPAAFYFVHSYHLVLSDDRIAVVGKCDYGTLFTAAATMDNIHLVQFHPEKSQKNGLRVLMNFLSN
jgi:imidazole glycerol-phosphate synthase subunit HisH